MLPNCLYWANWACGWRPRYVRRAPLVLVNGLAEQAESWYANAPTWRREFDVHTPGLLVYQGADLHARIAAGETITIDYLVEKLRRYLVEFVQAGPCPIVANSLGGKIAVELAVRHPELVSRLVLLCPSGLAQEERLPVVEGVRRNDPQSLVGSVFHSAGHADANLLKYYQARFGDRSWKSGLLRTIRGTLEHRVRDRMPLVTQPTLVVVGQEDRIVDPGESISAARLLPNGKLVVLPGCGHAPQIERASVINRLVADFVRASPTASTQ